jgi:hypothetical protein
MRHIARACRYCTADNRRHGGRLTEIKARHDPTELLPPQHEYHPGEDIRLSIHEKRMKAPSD